MEAGPAHNFTTNVMPTDQDQKRTLPEQPSKSQHLTVRPDDGRPGDVRFMFEGLPQEQLGRVLGGSALSHGAVVALWFLFVWLVPDPIREAILPDFLPRQLVFLAEPGPGGGGGGGNSCLSHRNRPSWRVGKKSTYRPLSRNPHPSRHPRSRRSTG